MKSSLERPGVPISGEILQQYLDGELPEREMLAVSRRLEQEPELMEELDALERLRTALRREHRTALEKADFSNFWAGVEAGIAAPQQATAAVPDRKLTLLERFRGWFAELSWIQVGYGAAATAAVLLAVGVSYGPQHISDELAEEVRTDGTQVQDLQGSESSTVMVLQSPENATIIWIDDEETKPSEAQGDSAI